MDNDHRPTPKSGIDEPTRRPAEPGKKANVTPPAHVPAEREIGETVREYDHSSGDRNTRTDENDWPEYHGGTQRNADPDGAMESGPKK